jgi:hypothetical protein
MIIYGVTFEVFLAALLKTHFSRRQSYEIDVSEDEGIITLRNAGKYSPNDTA